MWKDQYVEIPKEINLGSEEQRKVEEQLKELGVDDNQRGAGGRKSETQQMSKLKRHKYTENGRYDEY